MIHPKSGRDRINPCQETGDTVINEVEQIAEIYEQLVARRNAGKAASFSSAEATIDRIVSTRTEMDMGGFASVFEQLLSRPELIQLIADLRDLSLQDSATRFTASLVLLDAVGFFDADGQPAGRITDDTYSELERIGDTISDSDALWQIDDELLRRYQALHG